MAEAVRKYHLPDFSNWKNHDAFERVFARLENALRTSIGKSLAPSRLGKGLRQPVSGQKIDFILSFILKYVEKSI